MDNASDRSAAPPPSSGLRRCCSRRASRRRRLCRLSWPRWRRGRASDWGWRWTTPPIGALHLHHLLAFVDVVAGGLLAVDVFAGFHGPDGGEGVPVIGSGDGHRLYGGIGKHRAHVLEFLGLLAGVLHQGRLRDLAGGLIHIAKSDDLGFWQARVNVEVIGTPAAETDDADVDR